MQGAFETRPCLHSILSHPQPESHDYLITDMRCVTG
jgi:hypothetical protein